jgi:hypothetical protein
MTLEFNYISFELLGDHKLLGDLTRKRRLPNLLEYLWGGMLTHDFHNIRRRYCSGIWKAFKNSSDSKPVISMAMCNIDSSQILATSGNPIRSGISLFDSGKGVN